MLDISRDMVMKTICIARIKHFSSIQKNEASNVTVSHSILAHSGEIQPHATVSKQQIHHAILNSFDKQTIKCRETCISGSMTSLEYRAVTKRDTCQM